MKTWHRDLGRTATGSAYLPPTGERMATDPAPSGAGMVLQTSTGRTTPVNPLRIGARAERTPTRSLWETSRRKVGPGSTNRP